MCGSTVIVEAICIGSYWVVGFVTSVFETESFDESTSTVKRVPASLCNVVTMSPFPFPVGHFRSPEFSACLG
ncbi:MAG: hypothetical protein ACI9G1_000214 [Pirellulaceae bacterium]|jgi:hypothetical protein